VPKAARARYALAVGLIVAAAHRVVYEVACVRNHGTGAGLIGCAALRALWVVAEFAVLAAEPEQAAAVLTTTAVAFACVENRHAVGCGLAVVAVGLIVAAAHRSEDVRAHVGNHGAGAGLIGRATDGRLLL